VHRNQAPYQKYLAISPRIQWEANDGYCGEVALISAGLYYGEYLSQYDVRQMATDDQSAELDYSTAARAAAKMLLTSRSWPSDGSKSASDFLAWIKNCIVNDIPVSIGILMNSSIFDGLEDGGNANYDHDVPVVGIESNYPLSDTSYHDDDRIVFSDNGVYQPSSSSKSCLFKYTFGQFQRTRKEANENGSPAYSLASDRPNYGIALTGIKSDGSTLPVQVTTTPNYEHPGIKDGSAKRPHAISLAAMITVSGMESGVRYKLYRYDGLANVPATEFNKNAPKAAMMWNVSSENPVVLETIMSADEAVYRAVKASAP